MKRQRRVLISGLLATAALSAAPGAFAQRKPTASKFVMMSLVDDQVTYVMKMGGGGRSAQSTQAMPEGPLDVTALQVMATTLPKLVPGAAMSFLRGSRPEYFSDELSWFQGDNLQLPAKLKAAVVAEHASHLLLLTKWPADSGAAVGATTQGMGTLSGLGFYTDGGEDATGAGAFTAPFISAKLSLVDLATFRLVRSRTIHIATPGPAQKFDMNTLQDMLITVVGDAVTSILLNPS